MTIKNWKLLALLPAIMLALLVGCEVTGTDDDDDNSGDDDASDDDASDDDAADDDAADEHYVISLSSLTTDLQYYTYESTEGPVEFFAVLGTDGDPRIAFDACEVCYSAGLGYSQNGTSVVCDNCGNEYPIDELGDANQGGGCWPGYLPFTIDGDDILIAYTDLASGAWLFA